MLYKSKFVTIWLLCAVLFAISSIVFIIMHFINQSNLYLAFATGFATLFFVFKGLSDYVDSLYCARKDRSFTRSMSFFFFGCGGVSSIIFLIQLIMVIM